MSVKGIHAHLIGGGVLLFVLAALLFWTHPPLSLVLLFFLIAFFTWLLLHFMGFPLTLLARATDKIVEGKYDEVVLPFVGNRQDEVALLTRGFAHMVTQLQEKERIRSLLSKVVSKEIADEIVRHPPHLGGEERVVSILFSDIRDFTTVTDSFSPHKTIEILNFYMTKMAAVIEHEGGLIDKFVGDEIMALFGTPVAHPQHALRAISTGLLMAKMSKMINEEREKAGEVVFSMGIAVHTGMVVAGNMGAEDRLNYTVIGRNVNIAARLCHVAKAGQLIISEQTLAEEGVRESFEVLPLEPVLVRGISEKVPIYEVLSFKWANTGEKE